MDDYDGYRDYFLSRRKWFFGILALTYVADIADTWLKGSAYLASFGWEYPVRVGGTWRFAASPCSPATASSTQPSRSRT